MSLRQNLNSAIANLAQQTSLALALLVVPKFLSTQDYGQAVAISVLIGLLPLSDLGLIAVFNRRMPAILAAGGGAEAACWNSTVLRFRVYGATLFGIGAAGLLYERTGNPAIALIFLLIAPALASSTFAISRSIVAGDFAAARDGNLLQAIFRLAVIPGAVLMQLLGWCSGQLLAAAALIFSRRVRADLVTDWRYGRIDWQLVRRSLPEAAMLGIISNVWLQMLSSGRLFGSFMYPDHVVAQYGLANAVYQAAGSLTIAVFIPQTVRTYRHLAHDRAVALRYVSKMVLFSQPVIIAVAAVGLASAPYFFDHFFPNYAVPPGIVAPLLISLLNYPVIATMGALLIGGNHQSSYLAIVVGGFATAAGGTYYFTNTLGMYAAAYAQLIAISAFAGLLMITVLAFFPARWRDYLYLAPSAVAAIGSPIICFSYVS